jgi:hypothetical protein
MIVDRVLDSIHEIDDESRYTGEKGHFYSHRQRDLPSRCLCASKRQKRLASVGELQHYERHGILPSLEMVFESGVVNLGPFY